MRGKHNPYINIFLYVAPEHFVRLSQGAEFYQKHLEIETDHKDSLCTCLNDSS